MKSVIDFKNELKEEVKKINLELTDEMLDKFEIYKNLLVEWNEKMNLTAIIDDYQIIMKHFVDCLEIVKYINNNEKVIDVGTGAGFPGVVIAIYFNQKIDMTLLDSLNKRLIFLEEVKEKLKLKGLKIVHARAEEKAHDTNYRECYDVVVSRAVANLPVLLEYDIPYLKIGGRALLLKGDNAKTEIDEAKKAFVILGCKLKKLYNYSYIVNEEEYNRTIIEILKTSRTPNKYPRNYGKIKKEPIK